MLLLHQQSKVLQRMFAQVVAFLEKLGFLVKIEKCSVTPSQCIVFLGARLDSRTLTISLPQPRLSTILHTCQVLLAQGCVPMKTLSTLIGRMSHASQTGIMMAPLHYRGLQRLHPLELSDPGRPEVVGLRERTSEWLSSSATPYRCHHLERCVQKGLGCSVPRDI